ncbi:MAG TPA: 2-dehydro-3-deoxyphosphogluconate aldolase, partial [Kiritimatiellia bacterium]|nr:2-dehydro-3-deoxyphosphogluconate aldolase [Kiritimatiellia bacterium]
MSEVLNRVAEIGVVPVIAMKSAEQALPLADALLAGGLPVVEITFRTQAAAEIIRLLARERPELIVGAGTVLTP